MEDNQLAYYNIPRHLFEVYLTDEEHFTEYTPKTSNNQNEQSNSSEVEEDNQGFTLHQGAIMEKYFYVSLKEMSWSYDYDDISYSGDVTIPYSEVDLNECYLGVRCLLRKDWEKYGETRNLKELSEALLGFITEQSFTDDLAKISLSGMSKLLEKKYQFDFTQMLRSKIIEEVIKTAGLNPIVDPTGLDDQIIDYSNASSEGDDSDTSGSDASSVSSLAKKVCKGKKTPRAKAEAIHSWIAKNIPYPSPNYFNYTYSPEQVIKQKWSNCADRSRLAYKMSKACSKVKCQIVQGPGHLWVQYYLDGKWVDSDPSPSRPKMGVVWKGLTGSVTAYAQQGMA